MLNKIFSERVKEFLQWEGINENGLAKATGLSLKSVLNWVRGVYYPCPSALIVLANYMKVTTDYLLGLQDKFEEKRAQPLTLQTAQKNVISKLETYRQTQGIKYGRLAKRLGVGQCTLTRWFRENAMPETTMLIRIAKLLDVSLDELLGRE